LAVVVIGIALVAVAIGSDDPLVERAPVIRSVSTPNRDRHPEIAIVATAALRRVRPIDVRTPASRNASPERHARWPRVNVGLRLGGAQAASPASPRARAARAVRLADRMAT
jgi:hypothetical protein